MSAIATGFDDATAEVNGQTIAYSIGGAGPPVLLLHGFPQMRAMWHAIAPVLATRFTVIAADLRGYGDSAKPEGVAAYAFREMADDQHALMASLGFARYHLVGHDRGARTAHRLALDHGDAVASLSLMDIIPTLHLLEDLKTPVAKAYYHWFFLAQPAPFPETMIAHDPDQYYARCLASWDRGAINAFDPRALAAYRQSWRRPDCIAAMCNDYRAAIEIDIVQDAIDRARRVTCPSLVLYGSDGAMARHYDIPAIWASHLDDMRATAMPGGHFFPDLHPQVTADAVMEFLSAVPD